jgi:hypothetical protein
MTLAKRTRGKTSKSTDSKKKKLDLVLDSFTIRNVLPNLAHGELVEVLKKMGPTEWMHATNKLTDEDIKKMLVLILTRTGLIEQIAVYLTFYEDKSEPFVPIFELGLGNWLKQNFVPLNVPKNLFLFLLSKEPNKKHVFPILPIIDHTHHYFCLNKNFVCNGNDLLGPAETRIDPLSKTPLDLYFLKLCSVVTCAKLQRWSECLAHGLSALDCFQETFPYLHLVFCYIALAANNMSVSPKWCCHVLDLAMMHEKQIEHKWLRLIVFQSILIKNGMHAYEQQVYAMDIDKFITCNDFYQTFLIQHLQSLFFLIEDTLVYQYVRQTYHEDCGIYCNKPPMLEKSFEAVSRILSRLDPIISKLPSKGIKEYFRGYLYLYGTMTDAFCQVLDTKATIALNLALHNFNMAKELWVQARQFDACYLDLVMMVTYINKKQMSLDQAINHFGKHTNMKYNAGASNFLFRVMLITMYWGTRFQPFPIKNVVSTLCDLENKVTNKQSYRRCLLASCSKVIINSYFHNIGSSDDDYPVLEESETGKVNQELAIAHHNSPILTTSDENLEIPSAESLLKLDKLAEQVYAFGYQISENCTVLANL